MKNLLSVTTATFLIVGSLACGHACADDGIAGMANRAAQKTALPSVTDASAHTKIGTKHTARKPLPRLGESKKPVVASQGTLIHPKIQDAGVNLPVSKPFNWPQQEDYHTIQTY